MVEGKRRRKSSPHFRARTFISSHYTEDLSNKRRTTETRDALQEEENDVKAYDSVRMSLHDIGIETNHQHVQVWSYGCGHVSTPMFEGRELGEKLLSLLAFGSGTLSYM